MLMCGSVVGSCSEGVSWCPCATTRRRAVCLWASYAAPTWQPWTPTATPTPSSKCELDFPAKKVVGLSPYVHSLPVGILEQDAYWLGQRRMTQYGQGDSLPSPEGCGFDSLCLTTSFDPSYPSIIRVCAFMLLSLFLKAALEKIFTCSDANKVLNLSS